MIFYFFNLKYFFLHICTPAPGFEPGYPCGNQISNLAQYQVVPRRHEEIDLLDYI